LHPGTRDLLVAPATLATVSRLSCVGYGSVAIVLTPLVATEADEKWSGYTVSRNGVWDSRPFRGALLNDGTSSYKVTSDGQIVALTKGWDHGLPVPLGSIAGLTPALAPERQVRLLPASAPEIAASVTCQTNDFQKTAYTLLGFVAYRFH